MTTPVCNPFRVLGLPVRADLSDDEVRNAWRRIASATHPDREDGGDPARYREAANAYTLLRTTWGRSEAYADVRAGLPIPPDAASPPWNRTPPARPRLSPWRLAVLLSARIRHGKPHRLALRIAAAALAGLLVWHSGAGTPPIAALLTGIGTWLVLTARGDLAPPPGR
jgi:DnaJ domain